MNCFVKQHQERPQELTSFITQAGAKDLFDLSSVHLQAFPGHFLESFGREFLRIYYGNYFSDNEHLLLVAKSQGRVIGFVAGTCDPEGLYQSLFRNHFFSIIGIAIKRFLLSKDFRRGVLKRTHFIADAVKCRIFRQIQNSTHMTTPTPQEKGKTGRLLSIAVIDRCRGTGVSQSLIQAFETEARSLGCDVCMLSVKPDNLRGIHFYEKADWHVSKHTGENIIYLKKL
jgi:ribosomal protein S18 acetylase RimI-like enzyme